MPPTVDRMKDSNIPKEGKRIRLSAERGDLVTVNDGGREITGLVHLSGRHIVAAGGAGLNRYPIEAIVRAWLALC